MLGELERTLRVKFRVPAATVQETVAFLRAHAVVVSDAPPLDLKIRDKDDEAVLAEAVQELAEVLVTGVNDLLSVAKRAPISILSPRGLWETLKADSP